MMPDSLADEVRALYDEAFAAALDWTIYVDETWTVSPAERLEMLREMMSD